MLRRGRPVPLAGVIALLAIFVMWRLAVSEPRDACEQGNAAACSRLGWSYEEPGTIGANQDLGRAADLYHRGCMGHDLDGCVMVGHMYEAGHGEGRAADLFALGCRRQLWPYCDALALAFDAGRGVPEDPVRAAGLHSDACANGVWPACVRLARLHDLGRGVAEDHGRAAELLARACSHGDAVGCINLSDHYGKGQGVPLDPARSNAIVDGACAMMAFGCTVPRIHHDRYERWCAGPRDTCGLITPGKPADADPAPVSPE